MYIEDSEYRRFADIDVAIAELNSLEWFVSYQITDGEHDLFTGELHLASLGSFEAMHAFVVGMAVHQASLPPEVIKLIGELFAENG